jgi:WD40 repeat protein
VWDASSGKLVSSDNYLRGKIYSVEFDATSSRVVAAGTSGKVLVTDAALGMPLALLEGPAKLLLSAHFDRLGRRVVGASWDGATRVWDAVSTYLRWRSPRASDDCYTTDKLEPDRRFVAVGCAGRPTRVWDTANDRLLAELPPVSMASYTDSPLPAVSAAGDHAAIAHGNTVAIYAIPGATLVRSVEHRAAVNAIAFATTGDDLISGGSDGSVLVAREGRDPIALPSFVAPVDAVAFLSDGRPVAAAGGRLRIYHADRAALYAEFDASFRVVALRASADARRLLAVPSLYAASALPMLCDVDQRRVISSLIGHIGTSSARFVHNDREILTSETDGTARLWDAATGKLLRSYRASPRSLTDATLDPDGLMIVTTDTDGLVRFLDAATERPLWTLFAHRPSAIALHFEGRDLVTRGLGGDVAHWTLPKPADILAAAQDLATPSAH